MQIMHNFNISFIFLWNCSIDVIDLDMPFNCHAKILEPFKMKFIWGLQFWSLQWRTLIPQWNFVVQDLWFVGSKWRKQLCGGTKRNDFSLLWLLVANSTLFLYLITFLVTKASTFSLLACFFIEAKLCKGFCKTMPFMAFVDFVTLLLLHVSKEERHMMQHIV